MNNNSNKNYCIIMAGGVGSRFWPLSRSHKPKQFLDILGTGKTFLQETYERFRQIMPAANILVVTNAIYDHLVKEQIPELDPGNILLEPLRKNTAPCIAYAVYKIKSKTPAANIVVAPSDHLIIKVDEFIEVIKQGLSFVDQNDALLTLGIKPSRPETGYGYIQVNGETENSPHFKNFRKVKTFTEKPDYDQAKMFVELGEFYWNSGIFLWSLSSILDAIEKHLPDVNSLFAEGADKYYTPAEEEYIADVYPRCKNISIDYGIMENADNVHVLCADFGWSDLGTWSSLYEQSPHDQNGNSIRGNNVFAYELDDCLVDMPKDKIVVLQGLKDYVVVESDDMLLVCSKKDEQKIRQYVNDIKIKKGESYI
ncbi:MAG: mannose-1-phosphate guanylyltransferase [Bacteroidota bacterium]